MDAEKRKLRIDTLQPVIEGRIRAEFRKHSTLDWIKIASIKVAADIVDLEDRWNR